MATETLYASSHITGTAATPTNALGAANGTWTTNTGNTSWTSRWAMDNPTNSAANGTHTVTVRARKEAGQSGTPTITNINLYENGTLIQDILGGTTNITSTTGQDVAPTFNSSILSGRTLADIEVEVVTVAAGGNPSTRTAVQIDSITWSGDFLAGPTTVSASDTASLAVSETSEVLVSFTASESNSLAVSETSDVDQPGGSDITDDFNRADASTLGTSTSGHVWEQLWGEGAIESNQARLGHAGGGPMNGAAAVIDSGSADGTVSLYRIANTEMGLILRYVDNNNFIHINNSRAYERVSGVDSMIGGTHFEANAYGTNETMSVVLSGANVTLYKNGTQIHSGTTSLTTGTKHGIGLFTTNNVGTRYEDFSIQTQGTTPVTGSESNALSVTESASVAKFTTTTDTAAVSVAETTAIAVTPNTRTDTAAISVAETTSIVVTFTATDSAAVSVAETTASARTIVASDSVAIAVSDTSSVNAGGSPSATDNASIAVTDSVALLAKTGMQVTDQAALSVTETSSLFITKSASDTAAITVTDVGVVASTLPGQDTAAIAVTETHNILVTQSRTDSATISLTETTSSFRTISASDGAAITVAEETGAALQKSATDSVAISVSEQSVKVNIVPSEDDVVVTHVGAVSVEVTHATNIYDAVQAEPSSIEIAEVYI